MAKMLGPVLHPLDVPGLPAPQSGNTAYRLRTLILQTGEVKGYRCELAGRQFVAQWPSTALGIPEPRFLISYRVDPAFLFLRPTTTEWSSLTRMVRHGLVKADGNTSSKRLTGFLNETSDILLSWQLRAGGGSGSILELVSSAPGSRDPANDNAVHRVLYTREVSSFILQSAGYYGPKMFMEISGPEWEVPCLNNPDVLDRTLNSVEKIFEAISRKKHHARTEDTRIRPFRITSRRFGGGELHAEVEGDGDSDLPTEPNTPERTPPAAAEAAPCWTDDLSAFTPDNLIGSLGPEELKLFLDAHPTLHRFRSGSLDEVTLQEASDIHKRLEESVAFRSR